VIRNVAIAIGIALAGVVAVQWIHVSDRERVEEEMERLFELAQEGGEDAVRGILGAFAEDYRGSGPFGMASIERNLRYALVPPGTAKNVRHGDFEPLAEDGGILVPIVSVQGEVKGAPVRFVVSVRWERRAGEWKIVDITRWKMGR